MPADAHELAHVEQEWPRIHLLMPAMLASGDCPTQIVPKKLPRLMLMMLASLPRVEQEWPRIQ